MTGINDTTQHSGRWYIVQKVPRSVASWGAKLAQLHEAYRYRVEGLRIGPAGKAVEYRIPCKYGSIYPCGNKSWGWCGENPIIAKRLIRVLGDAAGGPVSRPVLGEEQVVWFNESRLDEVLAVTKARSRRTPNAAKNLNGGK